MDDEQFIDDDDDDASVPNDENEESFAQLLESYESGMKDNIRVGDKIRGRIISISDSAVFIDTGTKVDGVVEIEELLDDKGALAFAVGDELELFVVAADESEIRLSKAIAGAGGLEMLRDAHANNIPVEGRVQQVIKGGVQVEVLKRRAFCPISQIDTAYVDKPENYIGKTYSFLIKRLTEGGRNIVLSRRELLEAEQKKARDAFLENLTPDQVFTGRVTRVMPYGAFVELVPGVEGMVHISELSWTRLDTPEDAVKPGDKIEVMVLRVEPGEKQRKIALSVKKVLGDPWEKIGEQVRIGQKVTGKVTRCTKFGAFVEIAPGVEGLVHISEMSYTQRVHKPEDVVQTGQRVPVMIKEIDTGKRRVSLSLKDAAGDPWLEVETKYKPGQAVVGTIENKESFGLFVALEPGVVGLLPKSEINRSAQASQIDKLKPGETIDVAVETVHLSDRKISLKLRDGQDEKNWRTFTSEDNGPSSAFGELGEKLANAIKNKKDS